MLADFQQKTALVVLAATGGKQQESFATNSAPVFETFKKI